MKNKHKWLKRPAHFGLALLLIGILGIGTTVAFFTDIEAAVNSITTGGITIETNEDVEGITKTNIGVTATGRSKCYVRVRVDVPTVTYQYKNDEGDLTDGTAMVTTADSLTAITATAWAGLPMTTAKIERADGTSFPAETWVKKDDGFWYLSITLNKDDKALIINEITYPGLWDVEKSQMVNPLPDGLTLDMLTIPITSEAVQAEEIDVGEARGAEAAFRAFQIVNGQSS